jgi:hypothetical protein
LLKRKSPKQQCQGNFLKNFQKKSPHFEEEGYEIVKSFEGIGQICSCGLWKLSYLISRFNWFVTM